MRIALGVEYNGSHFSGWQRQKHAVRTVQAELESAVSVVANHPVSVVCAGRTDTGVHALGQVVHFDTESVRSDRNWLLGINVNLPQDVNINWVRQVDADFHARFSAVQRTYEYIILNRATRSSLQDCRTTWEHHQLNAEQMHQAGQLLVGTHDFSSYRALRCQAKSPVRTIHRLDVVRQGNLISIRVTANAFLHHMIRNITGVLIAIGKGDRSVDWSRQVLEFQDRTKGGMTASPHGLYFVEVVYPEKFQIPAPPVAGLLPQGVTSS